jgi:putative transposase
MLIAERFLSNIVKDYRNHPVSTDGDGTWYYPQACRFLNLDHHIQSPYEKSIIERIMIQHIKDRTIESFDDYYFPCLKKKNCKLKHVTQWFDLFVFHYNTNIRSTNIRS